MVSAPLPAGQASTAVSVLAACIASRNEQSPSLFSSSLVVVTVIPAALAKWQGAVDEVVLRAITAEDTVAENSALLRAARPS